MKKILTFSRWIAQKICLFTYLFVVVMLFSVFADAQDKFSWNGRQSAVVLTYDDALRIHLDQVIPSLDSLSFKGTFYLSGYYASFKERMSDWKTAAAHGHELGNHTLFHPCEGKAPGREWVNPDYDLNGYTVGRMVDEIRMTNTLIESIDGKKKRTFAFTCGDTLAGGKSFVENIKSEFVAARGVQAKLQRMHEINLFNVGSFMVNGETGEELIALVKRAVEQRSLLVFLFHGVGGEHTINVSLDAHRKLLKYLKMHENNIWIAPMVDIAEFVREQCALKK